MSDVVYSIIVILSAAGEAEHDGAEDGAVSPQPGKNTSQKTISRFLWAVSTNLLSVQAFEIANISIIHSTVAPISIFWASLS